MNVALELFIIFFKLGLFCFGGGYAMVGVIEKELVSRAFMTSAQYADIVAISQVTPGPLAVNVATYSGALLGANTAQSVLYSAIATIAVSLPSFFLVYLIARFFKTFGEAAAVKKIMGGIRPSVIGLIAGSAILFTRLSIVNLDMLKSLNIIGGFNLPELAIAIAGLIISVKTKINPILTLLGAGIAGLLIC